MKIGDIVTLQSGGLEMTIVAFGTTGHVVCHWFESGILRKQSYNELALKGVEEEEADDPYDCGSELEESTPVKTVYDAPDFYSTFFPDKSKEAK